MTYHWWFIFGYLWSLPHTLAGLLMALWYRPKNWKWSDGCLECTVPGPLIGGSWVGAQTWGWLIFYNTEVDRKDRLLRVHERVHVVQGFYCGLFYVISYGVDYLLNRYMFGNDHEGAYFNIFWEQQAYGVENDVRLGLRPEAWGNDYVDQ